MLQSLSKQKKGGVSGVKRMCYTTHQKLNLLCSLDELQLCEGQSIWAATQMTADKSCHPGKMEASSRCVI
jgi:hypothetical protein